MQKEKSCLIVLAASRKIQDYITVFNTVPSLIPFNGKPLIYHIILNFIERFDGPIFVALPKNEERIEKFLTATFSKRAWINYVYIEDPKPKGQAKTLHDVLDIMKSMEGLPNNIVIANGDIFFELPAILFENEATAFVENYFSNDKYSTFTFDNGKIEFVDIGKQSHKRNKVIDSGVYTVQNWKEIKIDESDYLSTVGKLLVKLFSGGLSLGKLKNWVDLGHIDSSSQISTKILGAREFNNIKVDEKRGILTKSSSKQVKILQEINYYLKLPRKLSIYFPRLYDYDLGKNISYSIEYYPYKTLSEYFVMYELPLEVWKTIFRKILAVYKDFMLIRESSPNEKQVHNIYINKLHDRLAAIEDGCFLKQLINEDYVVINGDVFEGWQKYLDLIYESVKTVSKKPVSCVIHGDLCFSNILYDPPSGVIKFIDPRGEFYNEGVFGDYNYDWAKLLHSVDGGYDFIIHQMYCLDRFSSNDFSFNLIQTENTKQIKLIFLSVLKELFSIAEIKRLLVFEAMLFLSMLPLHKDDENRQVAFYLTALKILKKAKSYEGGCDEDLY